MVRRKSQPSPRFRIGRVTVYEPHGAWWLYFRDGGRTHRRKIAAERAQAETIAAQVNSRAKCVDPESSTYRENAKGESFRSVSQVKRTSRGRNWAARPI